MYIIFAYENEIKSIIASYEWGTTIFTQSHFVMSYNNHVTTENNLTCMQMITDSGSVILGLYMMHTFSQSGN